MGFHPATISVFEQTSFWIDYFWLTSSDAVSADAIRGVAPELDEPISFSLAGDYSLVLCIGAEINLSMTHSALPSPIELGWDDQAHWQPNALRWDELEAICKCLATRDAGLRHPGWPLLLLCRFAPITANNDRARARELVAQALGGTRPCPPEAIQMIVDFVDRTSDDIAWQMGADGHWVCEGEAAYSLRISGNSQFPFELLEDLVECARGTVRER